MSLRMETPSPGFTCQGIPEAASKPSELREKAWDKFSPTVLKRNGSAATLISDMWHQHHGMVHSVS